MLGELYYKVWAEHTDTLRKLNRLIGGGGRSPFTTGDKSLAITYQRLYPRCIYSIRVA